MKKYYSIILLLFTVSSTVSVAQTNGSIQHNGITRNYIVYVPAAYQPGDSWPLVFVLHGFTQTSSAIMGVSGFNAIADTGEFIVAYPNGVGNAWNTNSGMTGGSTADDIGFISALTDTLHAFYNIDTTRVFSCGFSAGGYMSHRLACESPRCYAAVASVAGTMSVNAFNACTPSRDISVMQIHGTSDAIVSYNGSAQGGKSVADVIGLWVGNNSCTTTPQVQLLPDINTQDNSTVEKSVYAPCSTGTEVNLYKVIGGGHQWPGTSSLFGGLGAINRDISASAEIWNFFQRFSCPISSSLSELDGTINDFVLEQNMSDETITVRHPSNGNFHVSMYDLSGKLIVSSYANDSWTIHLGSTPRGIYVLKAMSGDTITTFKFAL